MSMKEQLKKNRKAIQQIAAKHGWRNIRVFGSVARGVADEHSDVDFLVDKEAGRSLLHMGDGWPGQLDGMDISRRRIPPEDRSLWDKLATRQEDCQQ